MNEKTQSPELSEAIDAVSKSLYSGEAVLMKVVFVPPEVVKAGGAVERSLQLMRNANFDESLPVIFAGEVHESIDDTDVGFYFMQPVIASTLRCAGDCADCECKDGEALASVPFGSPELLEQVRELCAEIEKLPAGPHQTNMSVLAGALQFGMQQLQTNGDHFWPSVSLPSVGQYAGV